jgi:hypothetical protein
MILTNPYVGQLYSRLILIIIDIIVNMAGPLVRIEKSFYNPSIVSNLWRYHRSCIIL